MNDETTYTVLVVMIEDDNESLDALAAVTVNLDELGTSLP